jgi:hypothetical protein
LGIRHLEKRVSPIHPEDSLIATDFASPASPRTDLPNYEKKRWAKNRRLSQHKSYKHTYKVFSTRVEREDEPVMGT